MTLMTDLKKPAKALPHPEPDREHGPPKHEQNPPRGGDAGFGEDPVFKRGW